MGASEYGRPDRYEQPRILLFFHGFLSEWAQRKEEYRYLWKMHVKRTTEHLSSQAGSRLIIKGLLIVGLLGIAERVIGPSMYFPTVYLIPIILVAWFGGTTIGIMMCIASSMAGLSAQSIPGVFSSMAVQHIFLRLGIYLTVLFILLVVKGSMEHEKEFARTDFLTGVGNRRSFTEDAHKEIDRARRYGYPFTVIYIDVDNLKVINDRFGHDAGDELLRSLARAIRSKLRMTDLVARLGGDEFGILLPEADSDVAELIVRRLQGIGASMMQSLETPMPFSMGVVTFVDPPSSVDEMLNLSDKLMYTAKQNGKHTICREVFSKPERISEASGPAHLHEGTARDQKNYQGPRLSRAERYGA